MTFYVKYDIKNIRGLYIIHPNYNKKEEKSMIDPNQYIILEQFGYNNKTEAYDCIRIRYAGMNGVTVYYDNGKWYIVQCKALM